MKRFVKIILGMVCAFGACLTAGAADTKFADETLNYVITYKWGLITKDSGDATLTLKNQGPNYSIRLTGKTRPWADGLYRVRDTLVSVMDKSRFRPLSYTKISHEGNYYGKDVVEYSYSGDKVGGKVTKYRKRKEAITREDEEVWSSGETFDMLSVFYWIRTVDPASLAKGQKVTATLFSGTEVETVKIWKVGEETIKMRDGTKREAWHIRFTFTSRGGKKTSDDIDAWISKDGRRIPLEIKGKLPLGHVCAYLVNP